MSFSYATKTVSATTTTLYDKTFSLGDSSYPAQGVTLAQSFSTGSNPVGLGSISVSWKNLSDGVSTYSLGLYAGSAGVPGNLIANFASDVSVDAGAAGPTSYSPSVPITLAPNSQYFVTFSGDVGGMMSWYSSPTAPSTDLSPSPNFVSLTSPDGGVTWSTVPGNFEMSVTATDLVIPTLGSCAPINATLGDAAQTIAAPSASAPGTFAYFSDTPGVAQVTGNQVAFAGIGSATITADFTPDDPTAYYFASTSCTVSVNATVPTTVTTAPPTATTTTVAASPVHGTRRHRELGSAPSSSTTTSTTTTTILPIVPLSTTTTSSSTTTTTTTTTVPVTTTPMLGLNSNSDSGPVPLPASASLFTSTEGDQFVGQIVPGPGGGAESGRVTVEALGADPNAAVVVRSDIVQEPLIHGATDGQGTFVAAANLPDAIVPGLHTLTFEARYRGLPVELVAAFVVSTQHRFETVVQPAVLTKYQGPRDPRVLRALRFAISPYDVASYPRTTVGLIVAGSSLLAFAGVGGIGRLRLGEAVRSPDHAKARKQSKVASAVTKKLKAIGTEHSAWGDDAGTWRNPLTTSIDRLSGELPLMVGRYSALLPRIFVDGSWLRAAFGGNVLFLWLVAGIAGLLSLISHSGSPLIPSIPLIFTLVALGILDSLAGAIAWVLLLSVALVTGSIQGWADIRTVLGIGVLIATVPLLAHAIRPLRRLLLVNVQERWERLFDYVMMPVFVAFAAASMAKAINGLSGLMVFSASDLDAIRWVVGTMIVLRLLGEDLVLHLYPERSKSVQPQKLAAPRRVFGLGAVVFKFLLYLAVMDPYFGLTVRTILAAGLLAVPGLLKLWEDELWNSKALHRWLPRGLTNFLFMLIIGSALSVVLVGQHPTASKVNSTFLLLLVPSVTMSILEIFGREGLDWTNVWLKRALGALVWMTAAGLVTGLIVLF